MSNDAKFQSYYTQINQTLFNSIPGEALTILEVGCGEGKLGATLKAKNPNRVVYGLEKFAPVAQKASEVLDQVFTLDAETEVPPIPEGTLDAIIYGDVLEHLQSPQTVLQQHQRLLKPSGKIYACVPNVQHHSLLTALTSGDFQYTRSGLLDSTHVKFFSRSTLIKLFLDAGYLPKIRSVITAPVPESLQEALSPLIKYLKMHPIRAWDLLGTYQHIIEGTPTWETQSFSTDLEPMTFVVCVNNEEQLRANLLASPCLQDSPHEVLFARNCQNAAQGLNAGLEKAKHQRVVCLHQDVYLPKNWDQKFLRAWKQAEQFNPKVAVVGVYGVQSENQQIQRVGKVIDREIFLDEPSPLPAHVGALDELLIGVNRASGLRFNPKLGFHFYGADICLQAQSQGLVAVAIDAPCFHNSRSLDCPPEFFTSAQTFFDTWRHRCPLATPCAYIESDGSMKVLPPMGVSLNSKLTDNT